MQTKLVITFSLIATLYLGFHIAFMAGTLHERSSKVCSAPYDIKRIDSLIRLSDSAYSNYIKDLKKDISIAVDQSEYWRKSYLWLKNNQVNLEE